MFLYCEPRLQSWYRNEAMGWIFKDLWFNSWQGQEIFLFYKMFRPALLPTWHPIQLVLGAFSLKENSRGMKLSAVTSGTNVKNRWNTTASPYVFMVCTGMTFHLWLLYFSYLEWGKPVFFVTIFYLFIFFLLSIVITFKQLACGPPNLRHISVG